MRNLKRDLEFPCAQREGLEIKGIFLWHLLCEPGQAPGGKNKRRVGASDGAPWGLWFLDLSSLGLQQLIDYSSSFSTSALVPTEVIACEFSALIICDSLYLPVSLTSFRGSGMPGTSLLLNGFREGYWFPGGSVGKESASSAGD